MFKETFIATKRCSLRFRVDDFPIMNPIVLNKLRIPLIALFVSVSSASAIITDFTFFDGMNGSNAGALYSLSFSGTTSGSLTGAWVLPDQDAYDGLFDGETYVNLHSTSYGGGELRGQLIQVPEPSAYAALIGLVSLGVAFQRRRRRG